MKLGKEISSEEVKQIGVTILKFVDSICRENELKYFMAFGTLIGAVRHQGYIPWDDDIDICMYRKDYEKFRYIMQSQNQYRFIDMTTNNDYYFLFGRVTDKRTQLLLPHKPEIHGLGVFIDVFPIDNAPPKEYETEWYNNYLDLRKKIISTVPKTAHYYPIGLKSTYRILKRLPDRVKNNPKMFSFYCMKINELVKRYNSSEVDQIVVLDTPYGLKTVMNRDVFGDAVELEFEGEKFFAPIDYDKYLRTLYGDYMQLPPVDKRVSSHGFKAYWI